MIYHAGASCHVHGLLGLFDTLGRFLSAIFRERHAHGVLALVLVVHHHLVACSTLGLRYLLVAGANSLVAAMIVMDQVSKPLALILLNLKIVRFSSDQRQVMMIII